MTEKLRLFLLAGEPSGDRIGADLVQRLRRRTTVALTGIGGAELMAEGLAPLFPMSDLSVMGWSDVLGRLPLLLWRLRQTAQAIVRQRPDVVVLIDSQVFSKQVAKRVRRLAPGIPLLLYVAPTVWAWRPERAAALRPLFDEVLAILPFEPKRMAELGGPPTSYVGHPALSRHQQRLQVPERGPLLLLPGSRAGELRRHLGPMRAAAEQLAQHPRVTGLVLPTLTNLADGLRAETARWSVPVDVVTGLARQAAFAEALAAYAVSGTVTLELALSGVPMVVTYLGDAGQARRYARLPQAPVIALPNIVAGRRIVPEFPLFAPSPAPLQALAALLDDPAALERQAADFAAMRALLQAGAPEAPLTDPAERVMAARPQREAIGV